MYIPEERHVQFTVIDHNKWKRRNQKEGNGKFHMGFCALGLLTRGGSFTSAVVASEH